MASDTPRLPKGPKSHKFEQERSGDVFCKVCQQQRNHPIHVVEAADAGPKPHKFVPDDSGGCIFYGCFKPKDDAIHVTAAQADADPPPGDPDTGN